MRLRDDLNLKEIYALRFGEEEAQRKDAIWKEIASHLQRYVDPASTVLDIACDRGDFIRNIRAREKWATDLRDVSSYLPADVHFVQGDGLELADLLPNGQFDVVFMSNYLEHLPTNNAVIDQLRVARLLLRSGGRLVILQPNIRLVGARYWDFIDHSVALTERSLVEAAELASFRPRTVIARFLPYTTKSRFPQSPLLVRAYLAIPFAWRWLGKQTLYAGDAV